LSNFLGSVQTVLFLLKSQRI